MAERTLFLNVEHMTCDHCAESVLRGIYSVPGVTHADVKLDENRAEVRYDDSLAKPEDFSAAIAEQGYAATVI